LYTTIRKTAVVTGASRGIGRAIAINFAKNGYNVVINCAHSANELNTLREEIIQQYDVECIAHIGDIGDYDHAKAMIDNAINFLGTIDVLVNNAGISHIGMFQDLTPMQWDNIIRTNLNSVFNCSHSVIPEFIRKKNGRIINISSVWGVVGASCEVAYSASKGAINSFTKALAKELAPSNIQVNAIACGAIDTQMNSFLDETEMNQLINEIPSSRLGTPDEVANLVYDLANNHPYLTGQVIKLDGGWT